jgi:hypothetical protein
MGARVHVLMVFELCSVAFERQSPDPCRVDHLIPQGVNQARQFDNIYVVYVLLEAPPIYRKFW